MMNGISAVTNINNQNYQTAFKSKGINKKEFCALKHLDQVLDLVAETGRSSAEKKENLIKRSISKFLGYFKKNPENVDFKRYKQVIEQAVDDGMIDADIAGTLLLNKHFGSNMYVEIADSASRLAYLEHLKRTNPESYKAVLQRYAEERVISVASMSYWEMAKEIAKNMLKKS